MRLIDADKLVFSIQHELWDWKSVDGITSTLVLKQTISDIANEPTVEAITIDWIIGWLKKNDKHYCDVDLMLEDWEKEHENDNL